MTSPTLAPSAARTAGGGVAPASVAGFTAGESGVLAGAAGTWSVCCFVGSLTFGASGLIVVVSGVFAVGSAGLVTLQRHVASMIKSNKAAVLGADTVMLADCPRFVRWSPVFDGVWDFRSMARVMTNNNKLEANVISERLEVTPNGVMDRSHDFICGDYKFKNMLVIDAPHCQLLPVNSAADFIRVVRTNGMGFDLDRELPARWERQLLAATNRPL